MNFVANECAEALVHQLVPGEQALPIEFGSNNQCPVMSVIVALHLYGGVAESGFDQSSYFYWVHNVEYREKAALSIIRPRSVTAMFTAAHCFAMIVYYSRPATPG